MTTTQNTDALTDNERFTLDHAAAKLRSWAGTDLMAATAEMFKSYSDNLSQGLGWKAETMVEISEQKGLGVFFLRLLDESDYTESQALAVVGQYVTNQAMQMGRHSASSTSRFSNAVEDTKRELLFTLLDGHDVGYAFKLAMRLHPKAD